MPSERESHGSLARILRSGLLRLGMGEYVHNQSPSLALRAVPSNIIASKYCEIIPQEMENVVLSFSVDINYFASDLHVNQSRQRHTYPVITFIVYIGIWSFVLHTYTSPSCKFLFSLVFMTPVMEVMEYIDSLKRSISLKYTASITITHNRNGENFS